MDYPPTLLTFAEVRDRVRLSDKSLRAKLASGELRGMKLGAVWRVHPSDLSAYLERCVWRPPSTHRANPFPPSRHQATTSRRPNSPDGLRSWERVLQADSRKRRG